MKETVIAFIIWCIVGCLFIALGISALFSKKQAGFWANIKTFEVTDIKKYNAAAAKLFCTFGAVFILLGLPMLAGQNSPLIFLTVVGVMLEVISVIVVYITVIEKKYKKK